MGTTRFSFAILSKVAYEEADRSGLKALLVNDEIEILRTETQGKDIKDVQNVIVKRIQRQVQDDPTSAMIAVYSAMLNKLKSLSGEKP
jgi:hypothetical protein